jgi:hypothetical protein
MAVAVVLVVAMVILACGVGLCCRARHRRALPTAPRNDSALREEVRMLREEVAHLRALAAASPQTPSSSSAPPSYETKLVDKV